jgi:hypothetical protein
MSNISKDEKPGKKVTGVIPPEKQFVASKKDGKRSDPSKESPQSSAGAPSHFGG